MGQGTIAPMGRGVVQSLRLGTASTPLAALLQGLAQRFLVGLAGFAPGLRGLSLGLGFRWPGLGNAPGLGIRAGRGPGGPILALRRGGRRILFWS